MRIIKFRAWDKELKKMIYRLPSGGDGYLKEPYDLEKGIGVYSGWYIHFDHLERNIHHGRFEGIYPEEVDAEIMQFTGLLDKNGKEIYEGDIVRHQNGFIYIVEFSEINGLWCLVQPRKKDGNVLGGVYTGGINGQDIWRCEILGNIYENPELIGEKDE
jgi:hypothetical protein